MMLELNTHQHHSDTWVQDRAGDGLKMVNAFVCIVKVIQMVIQDQIHLGKHLLMKLNVN